MMIKVTERCFYPVKKATACLNYAIAPLNPAESSVRFEFVDASSIVGSSTNRDK